MNNSWIEKPLGELCNIEIGKTPYRGNKEFWDTSKTSRNIWLSIADLSNTIDKFIFDSKEYLSNKGASVCKKVKAGILLLSFKLTIGRLAFTGIDLYTNEAIAALEIKNSGEITKEFLYYFLNFFDWNKATNGDVKVKGKTLNKSKLKNIIVKFPKSLSEQQRIVEILDQSFAAIDQAIANTEKNLQNARELYEYNINLIFSKAKNDWLFSKLSDISKIEYGYTEKSNYMEVGPKFLRITDIQNNNVNWETVPFCVIEKKQMEKFKLVEGDIVFARTGATTGKSFVIQNPPLAVFASYLIRLRIICLDKLLPDFLFLFFQSKIYWDLINSGKSGSTQGGFNASKLGEIKISFPNVDTQIQIINQQKNISERIHNLELIYKQKLQLLTELKQSILQKAFTGELT